MLTSILSLFGGKANATPESDFWKWFQRNEQMLFNFEANQERTFDLLAAQMQRVHPSLTFEFGPVRGGKREFIISADGIREAFPKVEDLFAAAPTLPKWEVIKFRPRRDPFDIEYGGISVKASTVLVIIQGDGAKAGLTVLIPGYTEAQRNTYMGVAYLVLDQALGEYDVETRVGFIEVKAPNAAAKGAVTVQQLPKAFDAFFIRRGV
ncbi:hypothetical protein C1O66_04070 [Paucibacter aquatile]|uniref:Uncharacterized protein n=2 Tax=Kinneretia aquatilis TaxID=2070761 RepID=A0A2N8KTK8_9BURK|nr:hypothetical protein C1O66_04070 [Paucibacter aquatile]